MRRTQWLGIIVVCLVCVIDGWAESSATNGPLGQAREFRRRPRTEWPYGMSEEGTWKRDSTLGQLCKTASGLVVAHVSNVRNVATNDVQAQDGRYLADMAKAGLLKAIEIVPEKNMLGNTTPEHLTIWLPVIEDIASVPTERERVMVFLSDGFCDPHASGAHDWSFDSEKAAESAKKWRQQRIAGSERGVLKLAGEEGTELVNIVEEYVEHLRGQERDRSKYFDFLQGLLTSRIERVRLDARTDMLLLMPSLTAEELDAVTKDDKTDQQIRKYGRDIVETRKKSRPTE